MGLTRIQIINEALDLAQLDSSFQPKARNWLNIILRRLSQSNNYKFYNLLAANVPFVQGVTSYALPTDYTKADSIWFYDSSGTRAQEIALVEPYVFDQYVLATYGAPRFAMVDEVAATLVFNQPTDSNVGSYRLRYFKREPDYSLDNTDDAVVPLFQDQDLLIEELVKRGMKWKDDERYGDQKQDTLQAKRDFMKNMYQSDGTSRMDLNRLNFVRRTRR